MSSEEEISSGGEEWDVGLQFSMDEEKQGSRDTRIGMPNTLTTNQILPRPSNRSQGNSQSRSSQGSRSSLSQSVYSQSLWSSQPRTSLDGSVDERSYSNSAASDFDSFPSPSSHGSLTDNDYYNRSPSSSSENRNGTHSFGTYSPSSSSENRNSTGYSLTSLSAGSYGDHIQEKPTIKLFVRLLGCTFTDDQLRTIFGNFGKVTDIYSKPRERGFVIVTFNSKRDATAAMNGLQNKKIGEQGPLAIYYAHPKTEKDARTIVITGSLPSGTPADEFFGTFGRIKEIRVIPDTKQTFVEFYDVKDAEKALLFFNHGNIKVSKKTESPKRKTRGSSHRREPESPSYSDLPNYNGSGSSSYFFSSVSPSQSPGVIGSGKSHSPSSSPHYSSRSGSSNYGSHSQSNRYPFGNTVGALGPNANNFGTSTDGAYYNHFSAPAHYGWNQPHPNNNPQPSGYQSERTSMRRFEPLTSVWPYGYSTNNLSQEDVFKTAKQRNHSNTSQYRVTEEFVLHIEKVISGEDRRTTLMIANIPNKYKQKMLLTELNVHHEGHYDFLYLPIDFKNKCNVGYAFINFVCPRYLVKFYEEFQGRRWNIFNSVKICELNFARVQGKNNLISHFQNSSLWKEDQSCRPLIFDIPPKKQPPRD